MRQSAIALLVAACLAVTATAQQVQIPQAQIPQVQKKDADKSDKMDKKEAKKDEKKEEKKDEPQEITEIAGKSIEQWTKECTSRDPSKRENAIRTVVMFGPEKAYEAVPVLLAELKKHSATTPIDLSVRVSGANAISAILRYKKDPDPRYLKEAVAIMKTFLRDNQAIVKYRALQALPYLGPESRAAMPEVIALCHDTDTWENRQAAIQTLTILAADPKNGPTSPVLTALYRAMSDSSHNVRFSAVHALALLGGPADTTQKGVIVRQLEVVAAKDPDPGVQIYAHLAIMTVNQSITAEHLMPIAKVLKTHKDMTVRNQAAQAIGMAGEKGRPVASFVLAGLNDPEPSVALQCIVTLIRMEYTGAVPELQKVADDDTKDAILRKAASEAITAIQKGSGKKKDSKG